MNKYGVLPFVCKIVHDRRTLVHKITKLIGPVSSCLLCMFDNNKITMTFY